MVSEEQLMKRGYTGKYYRIGFRGQRQLPLFMFWREDWYEGEVVFAKVLFVIDGWGYERYANKLRNSRKAKV